MPLGEDGTVTSYCKILRQQTGIDPIDVRVQRGTTLLLGQINGAALAQEGSLATAAVSVEPAVNIGPGYATVQDNTGIVSINAPESWKEIDSKEVRLDSIFLGAGLIVSEDSSIFAPDAPKAALAVMAMLDLEDERKPLWDNATWKTSCSLLDSQAFAGDGLNGTVDTWGNCAGSTTGVILSGLLSSTEVSRVSVELFALLPKAEDRLDLTTVLAPLGGSLRQHPTFWDIPSATVVTDILNVRSGPSLDDAILTTINTGEFVVVFGRDSDACGWLKVQLPGQTGWISANSEYVSLDRDCAELQVVDPATGTVPAPVLTP
jgi:hypothetical protein